MKRLFITMLCLTLFACDTDEDITALEEGRELILEEVSLSYLEGDWEVTNQVSNDGETSYQIKCDDGSNPTYNFNINNGVANANIYRGSSKEVGECERVGVTFDFEYDAVSGLLLYYNTPNSKPYALKIIASDKDRFAVIYISGGLEMHTSIPDHITTYERLK